MGKIISRKKVSGIFDRGRLKPQSLDGTIILAHHRHEARCGIIVCAFVLNLELLNEIHFRAVLTLAHVAAQLQSLLERQKARRAIAGRLCHPKQNDVAS